MFVVMASYPLVMLSHLNFFSSNFILKFYTLSCVEQQVYGTNDGCIRRGVVYRRKSMNTIFPLHTRNYFNFKEKLWVVVSYGCSTNEYLIYIFLMISCSSL